MPVNTANATGVNTWWKRLNQITVRRAPTLPQTVQINRNVETVMGNWACLRDVASFSAHGLLPSRRCRTGMLLKAFLLRIASRRLSCSPFLFSSAVARESPSS